MLPREDIAALVREVVGDVADGRRHASSRQRHRSVVRHHRLPFGDPRASSPDAAGDERVAAADGADAARRPMQSRSPDVDAGQPARARSHVPAWPLIANRGRSRSSPVRRARARATSRCVSRASFRSRSSASTRRRCIAGSTSAAPSPTRRTRAAVPHHLIDLVEPARAIRRGSSCAMPRRPSTTSKRADACRCWSAARCCTCARSSAASRRCPRAATRVRAGIDADARRLGWPAMHARLAEVDAAAAARIHPNDAQRIQRALEVHAASGRAHLGAADGDHAAALTVSSLWPRWCPHDRARLHAASTQRFEAMMAAGLLDEVRGLYARGDLTDATSGNPRRRVSPTLVAPCGRVIRSKRRSHAPVAATRQLAKTTDDLAAFDAQHPCVRSL